jgi:hypothetical protein
MGLDTNIKTDEGIDLYYFRKDWEIQQWWIDLARVKYRHLENKWNGEKPIEETDGIDREHYKKIYEEGDFNCVDIPITPEDWDLFMKSKSVNTREYAECNKRVLDAFKKGQKVFINGWW